MFNTIDKTCLYCLNNCKNQFVGTGRCNMYSHAPTKREIKHFNYLLVKKKIRLKSLCKQNHLKLDTMKRMLQMKEGFTHRYLTVLKTNVLDHWSESELSKYDYRFENYV